MTTTTRRGLSDVSDRCYLRAEADILSRIVDDLDLAQADGAELRAWLVQRRQLIRQQLAFAASGRRGRPLVLDPRQLASTMSRQGQPLIPVITTSTAGGNGLSSAEVRMPALHISKAHVHHHTDIILVVTTGRAITLWWDDSGTMHRLPQHAGQHLFIPRLVPHAAINPGRVETVGVEIRSNPDFNTDNELLPELDPHVAAAMTAIEAAA